LRDLFKIKWLGPLLLSRWTWRVVRSLLLVLLVAMAAYGWHHHAVPGVPVKDPLMYLNLANYFFWVLWIMLVVFVALLFGRAWCTVCPLGWLNGLLARVGLKRELPGWLKGFVPVTLTLVVLQLSVYFFAVHRYPDYTGRLLALMLLLTVACGLMFRTRAFCSLFCPAGAVFGLYARVAPFELKTRDSNICATCDTRSCISTGSYWQKFSLGRAVTYWRSERPGCPVDLQPDELGDNPACTLCLNCVQHCDKSNLRVGRRPWLLDLALRPLAVSETLFFLVLLGMLTANFSKVYTDLRELLFWLPTQTALLLGWQEPGFYLLATLWVTLALPLLLLLPGWLLWRAFGLQVAGSEGPDAPAAAPPARFGCWEGLGRLALPAIPLILSAHVILALVKLNAKGGYFPLVLQDPSGVRSYLALNVMHTLAAPGVLIPLDILKWLMIGLLALGALLAWSGTRRVAGVLPSPERRGYLAGSLVTLGVLTGLYGATIIRWLFVR